MPVEAGLQGRPGERFPSGTANIYLTFAGTGNLFDVDEFTFVKSRPSTVASLTAMRSLARRTHNQFRLKHDVTVSVAVTRLDLLEQKFSRGAATCRMENGPPTNAMRRCRCPAR
jgi:hypothetical protein